MKACKMLHKAGLVRHGMQITPKVRAVTSFWCTHIFFCIIILSYTKYIAAMSNEDDASDDGDIGDDRSAGMQI